MHCICKPEENYVCGLHQKHMDIKIIRLELADIASEMAYKMGSGEVSKDFSDGAKFVFDRISKLCDDQSSVSAPQEEDCVYASKDGAYCTTHNATQQH